MIAVETRGWLRICTAVRSRTLAFAVLLALASLGARAQESAPVVEAQAPGVIDAAPAPIPENPVLNSGEAGEDQVTPPTPGIALGSPITTHAQPETAETPSAVTGSAVGGADASAASATLPRDLSPWGMFIAADIVVKAVMIGLVIASIITWTVCIAKSLELLVAKYRARRGLNVVLGARDLTQAEIALRGARGAVPLLVRAALREGQISADALDHAGGTGLKERVTSHLSRIESQAGRRMTQGTGVLATIGSTAPFVGLFGTVWGITNAFIGISESQTTNLAVVAPGIAEALLATAFGLIAAIPAVVIYNVFARSIAGYRQQLADASAGIERLVSRDIDYRRVPAMDLAAE